MNLEEEVNKHEGDKKLGWVMLSIAGCVLSYTIGWFGGAQANMPKAAYAQDNKIVVEQQNKDKYILEEQQDGTYEIVKVKPAQKQILFHGHR